MTLGAPRQLAERAEGAVHRALDRVAGRPVPGNAVALRVDGPEIFSAAFDLIASARQWIHLDNYIFRDDETGARFAEALAARAREGIGVRVLTDWLGSFTTSRRFWKRLEQAGVTVRRFGTPYVLDLAANITRDHRKLIVADGRRALIGGFCLGNEWAGDPGRGRLPWRETAVEVRGPAAAAMDQAFAVPWARSGPALPPEELAPSVAEAGSAAVRVVGGEPRRLRAYRTTELLIATAAERIWITDAYFVAPRRIRDALLEAARDGVDVRLLVPGSSDLPFVRNLTRFGYRDFLRSGVRIFEWMGPMLHAKTAVVDGQWTRVGSSNVNLSSLRGNYELDVLVEDEALADGMESQFRRDMDRSAEVSRRPIRVPTRIKQVLPAALAIQGPETRLPHQKGLAERRRRTVRALREIAVGARFSLFAPLSLAALVIGAMFFFLPRAMATVFGFISLWAALAAGIHAARRADQT